jgi:hypothetical protein
MWSTSHLLIIKCASSTPNPSSRVSRTRYYFEHRPNSVAKNQIPSHRKSSNPTPIPAHIATQHVVICLASLVNASNGLPPPDEFCVLGSGDAAGGALLDELDRLVLAGPSDC